MDVVLDLRGSTYYIDTATVTPFSSNAGPISAASGRPRHMAKREAWVPHQPDPLQRYGPPTNSHPGRLGRHPDHLAQQHLQTTGPRRHHVTAMLADPPTLPHSTACAPMPMDVLTPLCPSPHTQHQSTRACRFVPAHSQVSATFLPFAVFRVFCHV